MLRTSKPFPGGGRSAAIPLAYFGIFSLMACGNEPSNQSPADNVTAPAELPAAAPKAEQSPALSEVEPALGRPELLNAARRAADAYATGVQPAPEDLGLHGREFSFRIPLGCHGPTRPNAALSWSYDAEEETLRLSAKPDITSDSPLVQAIAGEGFEMVEGFWVPRPWSTAERCPSLRPGQAADAPASPPVIGLAQFFSWEDSRTGRRAGRAYQVVERMDSGAIPKSGAFNLVLSGRLKALPDGAVARCHSASPNVRPICLISAEFDRVSFENSETGATVAIWHSG